MNQKIVGNGCAGEGLYVFQNLLSYGSKTLVKHNPMVPYIYVFPYEEDLTID